MTCALALPARADDTFDRLEAIWANLHDYSVTIEEFEAMGTQTSQHELHYAFRKPNQARLDVVTGTKSGSTIVWSGGDTVTAYRRNLSFLKIHGNVRDHDLTSLRGNGVMSPNMGDLLACFGEHRALLRDREGPVIGGDATDELVLPYAGITCPDDSASDRGVVTLDVLDVSKRTGLVLLRRRYQGDTMVERWELKDYKIDSGLTDADLR